MVDKTVLAEKKNEIEDKAIKNIQKKPQRKIFLKNELEQYNMA